MPTLQTSLYYSILLFNVYNSQNIYNTSTGSNGEDIWYSQSNFIPQQSQSFGSIKIGQIMTMEFDFIFNGRTNNPRYYYEENFFRIGHTGTGGGCSDGSRYPSMWLKSHLNNTTGVIDISVTSGSTCDVSHYIIDYGVLPIGISMHIKITMDYKNITLDITGGGNPNYTESFSRDDIRKDHIGVEVPVWWMSDKPSGSKYNLGDGVFSNIIIISKIFTFAPTEAPTSDPTTTIPTVPTKYPTLIPSISPTVYTDNPSLHPSNSPITTTDAPTEYPTTAQPTEHPVTKQPTDNPVTVHPSVNPTRYPTISPVYEGQVADVDTTEAIRYVDDVEDYTLGNEIYGIDGVIIGIIIALCAVACCILIGGIILYKKKQTEHYDDDTHTQKQSEAELIAAKQFMINIGEHEEKARHGSPYTPEGVVKPRAVDHEHGKYLSTARKEEYYNTYPRTDDVDELVENYDKVNDEPELQMSEPQHRDIDYLSPAQRDQLKKHGMETPGDIDDDDSDDMDDKEDVEDLYLSPAQREELEKQSKQQTPGNIEVHNIDMCSIHDSDDDVVSDMTPGGLHHDETESPIGFEHVQPPHVEIDKLNMNTSMENKITIGAEDHIGDDDEYDVQYDDDEDDENEEHDEEQGDQYCDNFETIQ